MQMWNMESRKKLDVILRDKNLRAKYVDKYLLIHPFMHWFVHLFDVFIVLELQI